MLDELLTWLLHPTRRWPESDRSVSKGTKVEPGPAERMASSTLRLFPGQVVRATILESSADWARVQVEDHVLWAALKTSLPAGRSVWLEVERLSPPVHFRLLSEATLQDEDGARLLRALKLPVTEGLLRAVRYMLEQRLPFDARMLRQLHHWQRGQYLNEQGLQAAVQLQLRGFPLRFPLFYAVYRALSDPRQQRALLTNAPALSPLFKAEAADTSTFRLDWWRKIVLQALRTGERAGASAENLTPNREASAVLLGHALLQFPVTHGDAWAFYSFPLPPWLPVYGWLQLAVPKERRHGQPPAGHLLMQLQMPRLKETQIRLYWQETRLFLTIFTTQPVPAALRQREEERLRQALEKLGYSVQQVTWQRLDAASTAVSRWFSEGMDVRC